MKTTFYYFQMMKTEILLYICKSLQFCATRMHDLSHQGRPCMWLNGHFLLSLFLLHFFSLKFQMLPSFFLLLISFSQPMFTSFFFNLDTSLEPPNETFGLTQLSQLSHIHILLTALSASSVSRPLIFGFWFNIW